jgi:hypothetical protein
MSVKFISDCHNRLLIIPLIGILLLSCGQFGATPAATTENLRPRPAILPGTFMLLEYGKK